jgi:biotin carboxyl carrier protein
VRYYFVNQQMKDFSLDVEVSNDKSMDFSFDGKKTKISIKQLAGKNYYSFDGVTWRKLAALGVNETLVSHTEVYKVYRGFKPSGLNKGGAGALITQMPGKVVKILKKEGDSILKGDTVLILEAMKMENEIKSGADGVIKSMNVKEGQALESGFLMVEIEETK